MLNKKLYKIIDAVAYLFLLLGVVVMPLLVDKRFNDIFIIPKQYAFIGVMLASILFFTLKIALSKKISFKYSILDVAVLGVLFITLLSSSFSSDTSTSFFGRGEFFILNFIFLLFLALSYFLSTNLITTSKRWNFLLNSILVVAAVTAGLFIFKTVFHLDFVYFNISNIWNTTDKVNSTFGLWLIVTFVISAGQLIKKELSVGKSLLYFFISLVCLVAILLMSFKVLWWLLFAGIIFLLILGISSAKESRLGWLSALFAGLVLVSVFIAFGSPRALQTALPSEVALGIKPSWQVSYQMLTDNVKNFLIGNGIGTFGVGFSQFRNPNFNYDNMAWSLRFNQPYSTALSLLAEGGMVIVLLFIFIFLFVIGHVFHVWFKTKVSHSLQNILSGFGAEHADARFDVFLVAIAWVVLSIGTAVVFFTPVLWWTWWVLLGLIITGLSFISPHILKTKEWAIEDSPQYNLSFSFLLILVMAAVVMVGVWGGRLYLAELSYAKASKSADMGVAENLLKEAISYRGNYDLYHASLAKVYLSKAIGIAKQENPDVQNLSSVMASAVNEAKTASDLSPRSVALWENLATMYENASALVPEAKDWSIKSWVQATELEPSNPVLLWRLGNAYAASSNWTEAIKVYEKAISFKKDYLGAYVGLSNAYEQSGKIDKAIETYQNISAGLAASNVEVLYNYGRLLFNRNKGGDRSSAVRLWQEAIKLEPNYSNALFSLGLYYENRGEKSEALKYYYKVKDLNPNNKDITTKISNLVGGK